MNNHSTLCFNDKEELPDNQLDNKDNLIVEKSAKVSFSKSIIETLIYIVISVFIISMIRHFLVQSVKVDGDSMNPTLLTNERLLIEKVSYRKGDIERFDIIVFNPYESNKDIYYVKRVIGKPNETVFIDDNKIYINGEVLEENYGADSVTEKKDMLEPLKLGDDEYFVLGDNRGASFDSRDTDVGAVKRSSVLGKAWYVVYPFTEFGPLLKSDLSY